jgi:proline dehydrogenase
MLRQTLIYLSRQKRLFDFIRSNWLAKKMVSRFVAGDTIADVVPVVREMNAKGITATLDLLGESVSMQEEADAAIAGALGILECIATEQLQANLSIKLTQLGFDLDPAAFGANIRRILDRAKALGIFVRVDMEGSAHTQRTLDLFEKELCPVYGDGVGIVIQSYLRRSAADVERLIAAKARVRLCKGAYLEPPTLAFPDKREVNRSYVALAERLLRSGQYHGIATHDEAILTHVKRFAKAEGIGPERFEFQMLYGIRRDLQESLVHDGWTVRVYVPFGGEWYPYFMRRLAERPANVAFLLRSVLREGRTGGGAGSRG